MKEIKTKGIRNLEKLEGTSNWYWGSDYINGDLYEAEELFNDNNKINQNRLYFVTYPEGKVIEPIKAQEGQYFGKPIYNKNGIIILIVDFNKKLIKLERYDEITNEVTNITSIPLSEVNNCYNLMLKVEPLMLTRQGSENIFEIIYPNKLKFKVGNRESFCFGKDDKLYFYEWFEDEEYREEVIVRDIKTGDILERRDGSIILMPDGQIWLYL